MPRAHGAASAVFSLTGRAKRDLASRELLRECPRLGLAVTGLSILSGCDTSGRVGRNAISQ